MPERIAYLANQYPKVSHSFIRREIRALEARGVDVTRFALRGWDADVVDADDIAERDNTRYTLKEGVAPLILAALTVMLRRPGPFLAALKTALSLSRRSLRPWPYHLIYLGHACRLLGWMRQAPVDHLHVHFGTNSTEVALLLRLLGGPPYSFTVHGPDEIDDAKMLGLGLKATHADFVAAISAYTRSQLLRHIAPADWDKVKIVHCGLPDAAFAAVVPPLSGDPVLLCIGRLNEQKGHLILLDAFAALLEVRPEARLVLAGDGELRAVIEARIAALGLEGAVRITGWISSDQVREELLACRVLVQPSFMEGLPVVIMEAMAQHRTVISTYIAGIPELVLPGKTGWLVPAGTVDELTAAMVTALAAPDAVLEEMAERGFARVRDRHHIATEAEKLLSLMKAGRP